MSLKTGKTVSSFELLLMAGLTLAWGINWPIMKLGLAEVPPFTFRACASSAGAIGLFLIARFSGHRLSLPKGEWFGLIVVALCNVTIFNILTLYGVAQMNSGRASILAYTMPLWATVMSMILLNERISMRNATGLVLGLAAMALLFLADFDGGLDSLIGPLLVVAGAVVWAFGTTSMKLFRFSTPVTVLTAWQHVAGVIPLAIGAAVLELPTLGEVTLIPALCVAYNMFVTAIFCYWAFFRIVVSLPVVVSTVGLLMVPVVGVFSTALIFAVPPELFDYGALLLVSGAVWLVLTRRTG